MLIAGISSALISLKGEKVWKKH